ncbi:MAG: WD40 repeat domain-containing protein [Leptolyngbyaceae bacterium]|nr:WD40 repeat domain-containing protein [Leptolyngbyaceae bacterium]
MLPDKRIDLLVSTASCVFTSVLIASATHLDWYGSGQHSQFTANVTSSINSLIAQATIGNLRLTGTSLSDSGKRADSEKSTEANKQQEDLLIEEANIEEGNNDLPQRPWSPGTLSGVVLDRENGGHSINSPVRAVAFSPDGEFWASGSSDQTIKIWNFDATQNRVPPPSRELSGHPDQITAIAFSPDGQWLVSACLDGSVLIWDWRSGELVDQFYQNPNNTTRQDIARLAFSPDGQLLVTSHGSRSIKLWDFTSFEEDVTVTWQSELETSQSIEALAFSPDGEMLGSAGLGRVVELWHMEDQELVNVLGPYDRSIYALQFSPNGEYLAFSPDSVTVDPLTRLEDDEEHNTVRLWSLDGEQIGEPFSGHQDYITALAFSPDGQTLLSGSWDTFTRVWDVETGEQVHEFSENSERVLSIAFNPNNSEFVLGSGDGTVQFFILKEEYMIQLSNPVLE